MKRGWGWTQSVGVMKDGVQLSFGTHWEDAFFDLPDGYTGEEVARIHPTAARAVRPSATGRTSPAWSMGCRRCSGRPARADLDFDIDRSGDLARDLDLD